jgi:hypothetical protein
MRERDLAVRRGRLRQSVCRSCYRDSPLRDFFRGVAAIGHTAVDLLQPEEWALAKDPMTSLREAVALCDV